MAFVSLNSRLEVIKKRRSTDVAKGVVGLGLALSGRDLLEVRLQPRRPRRHVALPPSIISFVVLGAICREGDHMGVVCQFVTRIID